MPVLNKVLRSMNEKVFNNLGFNLQRYYGPDPNPSGSSARERGTSLLEDISSLLGKTDPLIIDVGAHRGDAIRIFRYTWPESQVIAFEADPRSASVLHSHWDSVSGVEIVGSAVLDTTGTTNLYQFELKGMSSVTDISVGSPPRSPRVGCVSVPSISLADYCSIESIDHIDLLSISSFGSELQVIRGGENLINTGKIDFIVVEMNYKTIYTGNSRPHEIGALMESLGYSCYGIYNQSSLGTELETADGLWQRTDSVSSQ